MSSMCAQFKGQPEHFVGRELFKDSIILGHISYHMDKLQYRDST